MDPYSTSVLWIVIVSFIIAFILAFGVGANDVANSFGTSVGARVLTLRQACILASIFEVIGAVLLGYHVSETVRKGIIDVEMFADNEKELMLGSMAALVGSAIWNLAATALSVPISGTHTVVGATVGYALVARGVDGVKWTEVFKIIGSWFISPLLSGLISVLLFIFLRWAVLNAARPIRNGLLVVPPLFAIAVTINVFSIVYDGSELLRLDKVPLWGAIVASIGAGLLTAAAVQIWLVPRIRRQTGSAESGTELSPGSRSADGGKTNAAFAADPKESSIDYGATTVTIESAVKPDTDDKTVTDTKVAVDTSPVADNSATNTMTNDDTEKSLEPLEDVPGEARLFAPLQILTACFASLAHGSNDVSNAVGPLVAVWLIYKEGSVHQESETPVFVLAYGGLGITVGLWVLGKRVIRTVGDDLTRLTPTTGFTIELGAALTVLACSKIGLPVSTTHCKVGSVVMGGWARSGLHGVSWKLFGGIAIAWLVTLPVSGGASAAVMALLEAVAL